MPTIVQEWNSFADANKPKINSDSLADANKQNHGVCPRQSFLIVFHGWTKLSANLCGRNDIRIHTGTIAQKPN